MLSMYGKEFSNVTDLRKPPSPRGGEGERRKERRIMLNSNLNKIIPGPKFEEEIIPDRLVCKLTCKFGREDVVIAFLISSY